MSSNSFGEIFHWTTFGESHGEALGTVIEGCPAGVLWRGDLLQKNLERRRPGQKSVSGEILVSARDEADVCEVVSGVFEQKTLGTPIACFVKNTNARSQDYEKVIRNPRRGHADTAWKNKFVHVDGRGGGRSSGRETLSRVIAGSVAQMFIQQELPELKVMAFAQRIGSHTISQEDKNRMEELCLVASQADIHKFIDKHSARFPSQLDVKDYLLEAQSTGESYGGVVEVWVEGCRPGLGEPVFQKIKSVLAQAMMSIGATCGFEIGDGFALCEQKGTKSHVLQSTSVYGGILGGITTGDRINFRVGFKPTSSILDVALQGRHDPCIVPRAVPVVEAMTWAVLADMLLLHRLNNVQTN